MAAARMAKYAHLGQVAAQIPGTRLVQVSTFAAVRLDLNSSVRIADNPASDW